MKRRSSRIAPVLFVILALFVSGLACGRGDTPTPTSVWQEPVSGQAPAEQPSAAQAPAEQPPAAQAPAEQPPAAQPPAQEPPAGDLPVIDYFYSEAAPTANCFYLHWDLHGATAATLRAENAAGSVEEVVTVGVVEIAPSPQVIIPAQQLAARVEGNNVVITWLDASNEDSYILMLGEQQSLNLPADTDSYVWENPPCGQSVLVTLISRDASGAEISRLQITANMPACQAQPQTVTLQSLPAEDGYVRGTASGEGVSLEGDVKVGDGTQNGKWVAFLSFDISGIPQGATIQAATLDLNNHTVKGEPFATLGPLGIYFVQYGTLDVADYVADWPAGRAATLTGPPTVLNPANHLQQLVNAGDARFQVRLQFQYITDNDGQVDALLFPEGSPALTVTYLP
jgi:hypothetical protein